MTATSSDIVKARVSSPVLKKPELVAFFTLCIDCAMERRRIRLYCMEEALQFLIPLGVCNKKKQSNI